MRRILMIVASLSALRTPSFAADVVFSGRIDRVVTAGALVGIIRGDEVRAFSDDGRPLLRLATGVSPEGLELPPDGRGLELRREEFLERYGVPEEERASEWAEALVDDEATLRDRRAARRPRPAVEPAPHQLLAASETELWIARDRTLWRVDGSGAWVTSTGLPRFEQLAAWSGRLLGAAGARLWLSNDGGATFAPLADAEGPVRALALESAGLAWATDGALTWFPLATPPRTVSLPSPARDLRFCAGKLLALHASGLVSVTADGVVTALDHGGARRLACGATPPLAVAGPRLFVSDDGGRAFRERADLPPVTVLDVAASPGRLWVATTAGLLALTADEGTIARVGPPQERIPGRMRARWAGLLPQVAIAATAVNTQGRRDLSAVAYAEFAVGTPAPPPRLLLAQAPAHPLPEPPPSPVPAVRLGPDRDAGCLPVARGEAVARALLEPERARSFVLRARHAAWLPELRVRLDRRLGRSESLDLPTGGSDAPGPLGLDTANDVRYEARATWDLSKLVFSTEELAAENQALRMADMRREVESLANRLYFERRRLKMELLVSVAPDSARARRELRVQELEAELDVLSGGAFTRCLPAPPPTP